MTVRRAGCNTDTYVQRLDYSLRCICRERGDRNTVIDDVGPYCVIIDREYEKIELEDVGINSSTIQAVWVTSDNIPAKKRSIFVAGGHTYQATTSPANQGDGWTFVTLKKTCDC